MSTSIRSHRTTAALAGAVLSVLVAAGCGGGGTPAASEAGSSTAPTADGGTGFVVVDNEPAPGTEPADQDPADEGAPEEATSDDEPADETVGEQASACVLVDPATVEAFLRGPATEGLASSAREGRYRDCTFSLAADDLTTLAVSVNRQEGAWDPSGWVSGEPVPVDGLGEASFATTDFGPRVGFLRAGATVYVTAGNFEPARLPELVEVARQVDARLMDGTWS